MATWTRGILLAALCVAVATGGCGGTTSTSAWDYVLAPEFAHYGGSYSDWSVLWWQWALEHPYVDHPLFDTTGEDAAEGQVDPVWFIGGIFGTFLAHSTGFAERTITIPGNVALFFPIINAEWDNQFCVGPGWEPLTAAELASLAYDGVNAVEDVYCEVDGEMIIDSPDLSGAERFRAISGTFSALMPAGHYATELCGEPPTPILVSPAVSDGIWMMLAPMPPGEHTIRFGGTFPIPVNFHLDIIYHVTVLP
jgi:hypothetical protein